MFEIYKYDHPDGPRLLKGTEDGTVNRIPRRTDLVNEVGSKLRVIEDLERKYDESKASLK